MKTIWEKILAFFAAVGTVAAVFFYILYDKKRAEALRAKNKQTVSDAELKAKEVSDERHESAKKDGGTGVANDTANILNDM